MLRQQTGQYSSCSLVHGYLTTAYTTELCGENTVCEAGFNGWEQLIEPIEFSHGMESNVTNAKKPQRR